MGARKKGGDYVEGWEKEAQEGNPVLPSANRLVREDLDEESDARLTSRTAGACLLEKDNGSFGEFQRV